VREYRDYLAHTANITQKQLDVLLTKGKEGGTMKAMVLEKISSVEEKPLKLMELAQPVAGKGQILVRVSACGVCHTELDEIEGRVSPVSEDFAYPIPKRFTDVKAAPLLCAGVIGYRALRLSEMENGRVLGLYGFGASAHIVIQIAKYKYPSGKVFVFTRPHQKEHQDLARKLGADWIGATGDTPPEKLNCAIDFTPVGETVREALRNLRKGGRVVINAIRKTTPVPELDYTEHLWYEKEVKSVANVTRRDAQEFLPLAAEIPIVPETQEFKLEEANEALILLKEGKVRGAGVLKITE